ncbi:MAG: MarR family winged helix-turn-helix transcriptional regulator [Clostridia bacterium]|nr:MarR family winged helix-turn-helix transcriptional regulator [Clostridia bacterium]MDE7265311.1 MarR family winged helix-turn-helix transcriptional regulator [Clostridia bacterium]
MEKIFETFTVTILKINKLVQKIKQREMREYGLQCIHVMCIYYLEQHKDGLTASELMRLTYEDKAAISRALKVLKQKGYIEYDPKTYNAPIFLTAEGGRVAEEIDEKAEKAVRGGSADMSEEERAFFYKCLQTIAGNLKKYYESMV